jgi:polyhydroxybutyrate depolymerase
MDPALANGATQRDALVHIPIGYLAGIPAPLVMQFHGAGPNAAAQGYEEGSPLHQLSDRAGFIDVFPQGLRAPNGNLGWNAYGPVYVKIAEIPFVNKLLDTIEADYCVNPRRIYASGFSNGANMVNYVACRDADRFAAVAPVVGPMFGQDDGPCRPTRPVPMIDIHSVNDPGVPYGGHPGAPDYDFPLPSVPAWLDGWAQLDGCPQALPSVSGADGVQKRIWTGCQGGARIVAYATNAGHAWPGQLDGEPAAQAVWDFMSSFGLPT